MNNEKLKNENLLFIYKIIFVIQIIVYEFLFYLIEIGEWRIKSKENKNIIIKSIYEIDGNISEKSVPKKDIDLFDNYFNEELSVNENNLPGSFISKDIFLKIVNLTYNIVEYKKLIYKEKISIIDNLNLELKINEKIG